MCGSYRFDPDVDEQLSRIVDALEQREETSEYTSGQLFPNNEAIVLARDLGEIHPRVMRWGFPGFSGRKAIYNARIETVDIKPMFATSLQTRRCAVPTSGFYEWDRSKQKHLFTIPGKTMYLAGIYNSFDDKARFCILTTQANASVAAVHDRMPIVLTDETLEHYLADFKSADALVHSIPPELSDELIPGPDRERPSWQESLF